MMMNAGAVYLLERQGVCSVVCRNVYDAAYDNKGPGVFTSDVFAH